MLYSLYAAEDIFVHFDSAGIGAGVVIFRVQAVLAQYALQLKGALRALRLVRVFPLQCLLLQHARPEVVSTGVSASVLFSPFLQTEEQCQHLLLS